MRDKILIGYEIKTGKSVYVKLSHLIVTGITQLSGKTTTLEALIKRSELKAVVFKTKIGEKGFSEGTVIPPYFKERFDWEYVVDLLESLRKEKMRFERGWIVQICKRSDSLLNLSNNIKQILSSQEKAVELFGRRLRDLDRNVITVLDAYLDKILPELQISRFSNTLELHEGINIIELERYSIEVASLIIKSVLDEVLKNLKNTIIVIPEAWRFIPEGMGNPCKGSVISFIRQGATNGNFVWIDSQDITGTDKTPLKQVSTWILGYQREINEIKRTLDQIPLSKRSKPKPEDIAKLPLGHFYVTLKDFTKKVYVLPAWLDQKTAVKVAKGDLDVEKLKRPERIAQFAIEPRKPEEMPKFAIDPERIRNLDEKIIQTRTDFFDKITQIQEMIKNLSAQILQLRSTKQEINSDEIVSLVLQKIPMQQSMPMNEEEIVNRVLAKVPKMGIAATYTVPPLEKLKKDILEETKQKLLTEISSLNDEQKKILKYVEASGKAISFSELTEKCLMKSVGGPSLQKTRDLCKDIGAKGLLNTNYGHGKVAPRLKEEIKRFLFEAPDQEIEQVYNHIIMELLK